MLLFKLVLYLFQLFDVFRPLSGHGGPEMVTFLLTCYLAKVKQSSPLTLILAYIGIFRGLSALTHCVSVSVCVSVYDVMCVVCIECAVNAHYRPNLT